MKCSLCGNEAFMKVKNRPICRGCKQHWQTDRELIRRQGVMALPVIYFRAIVRRLSVFAAGFFRRDKDLRRNPR